MTQHCVAPVRTRPQTFTASTLCLFFALLLISSSAVFAQDEDSTSDVLRVRTDLVTIPAFVTDSRGRRVAGLAQSDFAVLDNGRAMTLSYFAAGSETVALLFALDASGSIRDVITEQRDAALKLFSRFGHSSRVAVLHFGEKASLTVPFTSDPAGAESAFSTSSPLSQHTAIFDAVQTGLRSFTAQSKNPAERRILILISDGLDTASTARASAVINDARSLGVSIYVIHIPLYAPRDGQLKPRPAARGFRDLAEKTGGGYFLIGDAKTALAPHPAYDLAPVFRAIEEDLQGQYVLGYYPGDETRDAPSHRIEVRLPAPRHRDLKVTALRQSYLLRLALSKP